jgi:hypothetical protein
MLPRPPIRQDSQQAYLEGALLQVVAELVESFANMVLFLRQFPHGTWSLKMFHGAASAKH